MKTIAILNEKGGTAKTTTSVNLAASLGETGKKVLLVDLDGQAASSRWLGVEGDTRLADAMLAGGGLVPIDNLLPGVSLAPASGKLDSISHNLRPTQGSQLRRVLADVKDNYDYVLIDCPPSLGNRLIGNALLAASHAIVPVETSILALDGLRILLTMLDDIRQGFEHEIELIGALGCRFNSCTRLSPLVLAELHRALPGKVFGTVIHETVRMQECPASGKSILEYAPDCSAAEDYRALARELVYGISPCKINIGLYDLAASDEVDQTDRQKISEFRKRAGEIFHRPAYKFDAVDRPVDPEDAPVTAEPQLEQPDNSPVTGPPTDEPPRDIPDEPETQDKPHIPAQSISTALAPSPREQNKAQSPDENVTAEPVAERETVESVGLNENEDEQDQTTYTVAYSHASTRKRDNAIVGIAAIVVLGIMSICGWVGFKALAPGPKAASARPAPVGAAVDRDTPPAKAETTGVVSTPAQPVKAITTPTPEKTVVDPPKVEADKPVVPMQAKQTPKEVVKSQPAPKPTDDSPKETIVAVVSKPVARIAPKAKPPSKDPTTQPSSKAPTTQPAQPRSARAEDYPAGLTLTGVMYSKRSRRAIISGSVVYEGDKVKGVKVVKILPDSVEIEANGFRFLLGTGPKPVWLKATQVLPAVDKNPDKIPTDADSR